MKKRVLRTIWWSALFPILVLLLLSLVELQYSWINTIISFSVPFLIIIQLLLLTVGFWLQNKYLKYCLALNGIILIVYFPKLFSLNLTPNGWESQKLISVISYNTSFFSNPGHWTSQYHSTLQNNEAITTIDWLVNSSADIFCFQEFYSDSNSRIFNVIEQFKQENRYVALSSMYPEDIPIQSGLAIVSRFPIIKQKTIFQDLNGFNRGMFADVLIGIDTIRVINVHLQSMRIAEQEYPQFELGNLYEKIRSRLSPIVNSSRKRVEQMTEIQRFVKDAPYKVILCGDFNESSVSPLFAETRTHLVNTFEKSGIGFGFTTKLPLRIDHIFISKECQSISSQVYTEVKSSFHYPIESRFSI